MPEKIIYHCKSPLFGTFIHCPDCGDKLEATPKVSNPEQIQPDVLEPIKPFYPRVKTFTGVILSTHLYTRTKTVSSNSARHSTTENFEEAFNFITIKDKKDKQIKINIDGSGESANKVHVGDAITIMETMPLHITMHAPSGIKHMLNDTLADAFIVHNQDGSRYSQQNSSESFTPHPSSIFEATGAGLAFFLMAAFFAWMIVWLGPSNPGIINHMPWIENDNALNILLTLSGFIGFLRFYFHLVGAKKHEKIVAAYDKVITSLRIRLSSTFA